MKNYKVEMKWNNEFNGTEGGCWMTVYAHFIEDAIGKARMEYPCPRDATNVYWEATAIEEEDDDE